MRWDRQDADESIVCGDEEIWRDSLALTREINECNTDDANSGTPGYHWKK